jgi:hypothetical protein
MFYSPPKYFESIIPFFSSNQHNIVVVSPYDFTRFTVEGFGASAISRERFATPLTITIVF